MVKQPRNVLAVSVNHCRHPLFMAWRANSGYRLWLDGTAKTFRGCFSVSYGTEI